MKDKIELKKYYSTKEFLENYIYEGNNLGVECTDTKWLSYRSAARTRSCTAK